MKKNTPTEDLHPSMKAGMPNNGIERMKQEYDAYLRAYLDKEIGFAKMVHEVQHISWKYGLGGRMKSVLICRESDAERWFNSMGFVLMNRTAVLHGDEEPIYGLRPKTKKGEFKKNSKPIRVALTYRGINTLDERPVRGLGVIDIQGLNNDLKKLGYPSHEWPSYMFP